MCIDMNAVGTRIKQRRKDMKLTQTDIYNRTGLTSGALSKIENGLTTPSISIFVQIAEVLDSDLHWLLYGYSSNLQDTTLSSSEETLLTGFRKLSSIDQEELLAILDIKLRKY